MAACYSPEHAEVPGWNAGLRNVTRASTQPELGWGRNADLRPGAWWRQPWQHVTVPNMRKFLVGMPECGTRFARRNPLPKWRGNARRGPGPQ